MPLVVRVLEQLSLHTSLSQEIYKPSIYTLEAC